MDIPDGFIPLDGIVLNTANTRRMEVTLELVTELRDRFDLCSVIRTVDGDHDVEAQITAIRKHPQYKSRISAKGAAELRHIAKFACSLKGEPRNLLQAVRFIDHGDHKEISSGNNRLLAHVLMRAPYIKAERIEYANESERVELELAENLQRSDLSQSDLLLALKHLQDARGTDLTATEVQALTQRSRGNAASIIKILRYPDPILFDQIANGYFNSIHAMSKAAQLTPEELSAGPSKIESGDDKKPLFKLLGSGRDMQDALQLINEFIGLYYRNKTSPHIPDTPEHKAAILEANQLTEPLLTELAEIQKQLKDREGRYNYDRQRIQALLDQVVSLLRSLYTEVTAAALLAIVDKRNMNEDET